MHSIVQAKGFAVLTSALLLSLAGIIFTTNMAKTQLIDNQVIANYYRNTEAFINAESGIYVILSQLQQSNDILATLPLTYQPVGSHYTVGIEQLNKNTLQINALGTSKDGSAERMIQLQIYHEVSYNIPPSALASNGKLNIGAQATINEGCEGLTAANCRSPGNLAKYQLVSHPDNETQLTACTGAAIGVNQIAQAALDTAAQDNHFLMVGGKTTVSDQFGNTHSETISWPKTQPSHALFYGTAADNNLSPANLFESTFGVTREVGLNVLHSSTEVAFIDMTQASSLSCSQQLISVAEHISTIYIQGDCVIAAKDAINSVSHRNKYFSIGSVDHPKLVFIEGGSFITAKNIDVAVNGMVYFLPSKHLLRDQHGEQQLVEDQSISLSGIRVNGALLTDYNCSYQQQDKVSNSQHLYVRYDKTVLNTLYKNIGSVEIDSGYRIVDGSWWDF